MATKELMVHSALWRHRKAMALPVCAVQELAANN